MGSLSAANAACNFDNAGYVYLFESPKHGRQVCITA